ncbi:MAG: AAA family ATPase [Desulfurellaceae bacterium]|nr:AAA family ATPase [Desulfurellaceae bacterium]
MVSDRHYVFPPFRLDPTNACLWRDSIRIALRPTPFAILQYFIEHPGRLVTKEELLRAVWADTQVSAAVLKGYIQQIRKALGDDAKAPRFIETIQRRGYRFIAPLTTAQLPLRSESPGQQPLPLTPQSATIVGREKELAQLQTWFEVARSSQRQIVFVSGEAGIGKTTLVEAFLERIGSIDGQRQRVACGQCVESYGTGEAYLPILEALSRLCRAEEHEQDDSILAVLDRYAPTWLVQMPWLVDGTRLADLQRKTHGTTQVRMLREMAEAVEAMTAATPLLLVIEDLHWSDHATLDLIARLAQRPEPARLLVIATYRSTAVRTGGHPVQSLTQELQLHNRCQSLSLPFLTAEAIEAYLAQRFPGVPSRTLSRTFYQRTEGNPLFFVRMANDLIARDILTREGATWSLKEEETTIAAHVPTSLRQMIERYIERLGPEQQRALEAASIAGIEFSAAATTPALNASLISVERLYANLGQHGHLIEANGRTEWPDGTVAGGYRFTHALYRSILHDRIPAGSQVLLHQEIGKYKERGYADRTHEIAAELAAHFEAGHDAPRAVKYLYQAGENAILRHAHREAVHLFTKALIVLRELPPTPERNHQELSLLMALGTSLTAIKGWGDAEVKRTYDQAQSLCQHEKDPLLQHSALIGLWAYHFTRAELETASRLATQLLATAQEFAIEPLLLGARLELGATALYAGEIQTAESHLGQCLSHYHRYTLPETGYMVDPGVVSGSLLAQTLWLLGYPDQALAQGENTLRLARRLAHPFSLAYALQVLGNVRWMCGQRRDATALGEELNQLAREHDFALYLAGVSISQGRRLAEQGHYAAGIEQITRGLSISSDLGAALGRPYALLLLAQAYEGLGRADEGLKTIVEALQAVRHTEEKWIAPELYRVKGEILRQKATVAASEESESCFQKALDIARKQHAKAWELRAAINLSRLWQQRGKTQAAQALLQDTYSWFTEGFTTADLITAKTLQNV